MGVSKILIGVSGFRTGMFEETLEMRCAYFSLLVYTWTTFYRVLAMKTDMISSKGLRRKFLFATYSLLSNRKNETKQPKNIRAGGDGAEITCRYNTILIGDTGNGPSTWKRWHSQRILHEQIDILHSILSSAYPMVTMLFARLALPYFPFRTIIAASQTDEVLG
jgi:hypothetical protein